tara:strand:- start:182 stop:538 length:357 start_codon:yes stop_codon:yes gene_type:complete
MNFINKTIARMYTAHGQQQLLFATMGFLSLGAWAYVVYKYGQFTYVLYALLSLVLAFPLVLVMFGAIDPITYDWIYQNINGVYKFITGLAKQARDGMTKEEVVEQLKEKAAEPVPEPA